MAAIQALVDDLLNDPQAAALAIIVHVDGSATRKEGSWMVLKKDGTRAGLISGGCLENDLHKRADKLFGSGKTELITYDLSAEDDARWGRGAGYNGVVHVLLRDVDKKFRKTLSTLQKSLRMKEPVLWLQSMDHYEQYALASKSADPFEFWDGDATWEWNNAAPFQHIAHRKKIGGAQYYVQLIWPPSHS